MTANRKGKTVGLWGTHDDLKCLHQTVSEFWNDPSKSGNKGYESRNDVLANFSFLVRKAYERCRKKRKCSHYYPLDEQEYLGVEISWVQILFALSALKENISFQASDKFQTATILQLEYWLERAMHDYDDKGAKGLSTFISRRIYSANEYLFKYMEVIDAQWMNLKGGKKHFRELPNLLIQTIVLTDEYEQLKEWLEARAEQCGCRVEEMRFVYDDQDDKQSEFDFNPN